MFSRRKFLQSAALFGAGLFIPRQITGPVPSLDAHPRLDPTLIPKYAATLIVPPAMTMHSVINTPEGEVDYYEIGVKQQDQQILPPGGPTNFNETTVWSYYAIGHPETFNYPAFTIEAQADRPVRVKWVNQLVDADNNYLPHLLAVDPTLHWANPAGPRDTRPTFTSQPFAYRGPVPLVTHVHGAHAEEESDGFTDAWFLPAAANIPPSYFKVGSHYDEFKAKFEAKYGQVWEPGSSVSQYKNDQRASTLWYHDHALGMTRLNVYAGPAGFYMVRGGDLDLSAGDLPSGNYENPIAIQDRSFYADGGLWFPDSREEFEGHFPGPYIPDSDISPIWNPEFFGETMVVNGRTWPVHHVEPRRYRLRFLNGCNARYLVLKLTDQNPDLDTPPYRSAAPFGLVGTEGGFLPAPVSLDTLLMSPAERMDVIVDFTDFEDGAEVYLVNLGPDEPYNGGVQDFANPATTGQVMKFVVDLDLTGEDTTLPFESIQLPDLTHLGPAKRTRLVSLNEEDFAVLNDIGPREAVLGTVEMVNGMPTPMPMMWGDPITEMPVQNEEEIWEIYNYTMDAHPIHIHQVMFEVVNRESMDGLTPPRSPESWETGFKDTVTAYPGEITRVKLLFDNLGLYVWHCHIVDHEDNEMMRPLRVVRQYFIPSVFS